MRAMRETNRQRVVYGVTVGASAFSLLRGQLAWLNSRGWDVRLVSTPDDLAVRASKRENIPLYSLTMHRTISPVADLKSLLAWIHLLQILKPDAINVGTPKAGILGSIASWICRVPRRIYVLRGLRLEGATGPQRALLWLMEWITMHAATDVVVVSHSLGMEARRLRLLPRKGGWLIGSGSSNGVDSDSVESCINLVDRSALRISLGLNEHDFVVGYVGRITKDKGLGTLYAAMERITHPSVRLLLIGSFEEDDSLPDLGERAIHVPWTENVWAYYSVMNLLCLPTRREGFPNVVLEAASVRVPTITTNATGAVDSVTNGVTGQIVPVDDPAALAAAISIAAADRGICERQGQAARERVMQEFQTVDIWRGIESILRNAPLPTVRKI